MGASMQWYSDFSLVGQHIIGRSYYDLFPATSANWRGIHQRALKGESVSCTEDVFSRADGTTQYLKWDVKPWKSYDGCHGIFIYTEDITRQKETVRAYSQLLASVKIEVKTYSELFSKLAVETSSQKSHEKPLPVCSFCKDIRDDDGHWQRVESYFNQYHRFFFSHGVCPECYRKNYGFLGGSLPAEGAGWG